MSDEDFNAKDVGAEHLSVACRKQVRDQLNKEIEAFLAGGGQIQRVDHRSASELQQKPDSGYRERSV